MTPPELPRDMTIAFKGTLGTIRNFFNRWWQIREVSNAEFLLVGRFLTWEVKPKKFLLSCNISARDL